MGKHKHEILYGRFVFRGLFLEGGYWCGRVRDLHTNKLLRKSSRQTDQRKARQVIIDWIEELRDKKDGTHSPDFTTAFEQWISLKTIRMSTMRDLELAKRVYVAAFSGFTVDAISPLQIEQLLKSLIDKGRKPRTRNKHLTTLRGFFRWAKRQAYTDTDPTDGIRQLRSQKFKPVVLTPEEARALIAAAREPREVRIQDRRGRSYNRRQGPTDYLWLALLISLQAGLRQGNVLRLRWSQIDLEAKKISIAGEEMKGHVDHEIPIHSELLDVLQSRRGEGLVLGIELAAMRKSFCAALRQAGIPTKMRWHDLRHTFSSWLATRVPWAIQQQLLGHKPQQVTWGYTHLAWKDLVAGIETIPRLLPEKTEN